VKISCLLRFSKPGGGDHLTAHEVLSGETVEGLLKRLMDHDENSPYMTILSQVVELRIVDEGGNIR